MKRDYQRRFIFHRGPCLLQSNGITKHMGSSLIKAELTVGGTSATAAPPALLLFSRWGEVAQHDEKNCVIYCALLLCVLWCLRGKNSVLWFQWLLCCCNIAHGGGCFTIGDLNFKVHWQTLGYRQTLFTLRFQNQWNASLTVKYSHFETMNSYFPPFASNSWAKGCSQNTRRVKQSSSHYSRHSFPLVQAL